jgi:hypothetical protein
LRFGGVAMGNQVTVGSEANVEALSAHRESLNSFEQAANWCFSAD